MMLKQMADVFMVNCLTFCKWPDIQGTHQIVQDKVTAYCKWIRNKLQQFSVNT